MISIEGSLYHLLKSQPEIAAICNDRIYPDIIPQNVDTPAITIQRISSESIHSTLGHSRLIIARFQITSVCDLHHEAVNLSEIVRKEIDGYSGTVLGVEIQGIFSLAIADLPLIDPETKLQTAMARRADYRVAYSQI